MAEEDKDTTQAAKDAINDFLNTQKDNLNFFGDEDKEEEKIVFEFERNTTELPNTRGKYLDIQVTASDNVKWSINKEVFGMETISVRLLNPYGSVVGGNETYGTGIVRISCDRDADGFFPAIATITANGSYVKVIETTGDDGKITRTEEVVKVTTECMLSQMPITAEDAFGLGSIVDTHIAENLEKMVNNIPCCSELIKEVVVWVDNNVFKYFSGILDKGMSPISAVLGEVGASGADCAGLVEFLGGGVPSISVDTLGDLSGWLNKLLKAFKITVKFATMSLAMYVRVIKQVRQVIADLRKFAIEVPTVIINRLTGGACGKILSRICPALISLLNSFKSIFETIAKALDPILAMFDTVIEIIKEFIFDFTGSTSFLDQLREFLLKLREKMMAAIGPLSGCEKLAYTDGVYS